MPCLHRSPNISHVNLGNITTGMSITGQQLRIYLEHHQCNVNWDNIIGSNFLKKKISGKPHPPINADHTHRLIIIIQESSKWEGLGFLFRGGGVHSKSAIRSGQELVQQCNNQRSQRLPDKKTSQHSNHHPNSQKGALSFPRIATSTFLESIPET